MQLIFNWIDKIKRYYVLKPRELRGLALSIIIIAFAITFRKWGLGTQVNFGMGLSNFLGALLIVTITILGRLYLQKIVALGTDYKAEYRVWSFGLMITLLLVFVTNGYFWFLIPGGIVINYMPGHRLGWVRYGLNMYGIGVISLAGPMGNIVLAIIFRSLYEVFQIPLLKTAFILNLIWAIWNILPIPPNDGSKMFYGSRLVYMYGLAVVICSSILLYANINIYISIIGTVIIAWIWWLIYYLLVERFIWNGPF